MGFERNGIGVLEEHTTRNRVRVFLGGETSFVFFCTPLDCFSINQCGAANRMERASARLQMCTCWRRNWGLF